MKYLVVAIVAIQSCVAQEAKPDVHLSNSAQNEVRTSDIGTRLILIGRYGRLGMKRTFFGVIEESGTKKMTERVIRIYKVDGLRVDAICWDAPMLPNHPLGTGIEFEGFEMGRLERIDPLSNPSLSWKNIGNIGCRLSLEIDKVIRTIPKKDVPDLIGKRPDDTGPDGYKNPFDPDVTGSQNQGTDATSTPANSVSSPRQQQEGQSPAKPGSAPK